MTYRANTIIIAPRLAPVSSHALTLMKPKRNRTAAHNVRACAPNVPRATLDLNIVHLWWIRGWVEWLSASIIYKFYQFGLILCISPSGILAEMVSCFRRNNRKLNLSCTFSVVETLLQLSSLPPHNLLVHIPENQLFSNLITDFAIDIYVLFHIFFYFTFVSGWLAFKILERDVTQQ